MPLCSLPTAVTSASAWTRFPRYRRASRAVRRLPQVAAGEHVDERHERDDAEDSPGNFRAESDIAAGCQVDPDQDDGDGMDEAHEDLEQLLHDANLLSAISDPGRRPAHCRSDG